jgi:hypothetical protein
MLKEPLSSTNFPIQILKLFKKKKTKESIAGSLGVVEHTCNSKLAQTKLVRPCLKNNIQTKGLRVWLNDRAFA